MINFSGADVYRNHHIIGEIRIKLATTARSKTLTLRKYNFAKLNEDETMISYRQVTHTLDLRDQLSSTISKK